MFSKKRVLQNFALLEPLFSKDVSLLLQNTYDDCFWIFAAANALFQVNMEFIADSRTSFFPGSFENTSWISAAATGAALKKGWS